MKKYNVLSETALSDVCPEGWIRAFLESEKSGMPGNLHRIGYPYDRACLAVPVPGGRRLRGLVAV